MEILTILFVFIEIVRTQEMATPSRLLKPRHFNHHAFEAKQHLNDLLGPVPTRKGPVLFPPPPTAPPATPLIVTSRPLIESIARSDLNENLTSNTISDQSRINPVTLQPNYFAIITKYKPVTMATLPPDTIQNRYTLSPTVGTNILDNDYSYDQAPYTDIVKKSISNNFGVNNMHSEYETNSPLPPIYDAVPREDQKILKTQTYPVYNYQSKTQTRQYDNNDISDEGNNSEQAEDKSYAFSYTVKDQKTGDDFSHFQRSSGSATNGEYRVRLPDGRVQIVSYTADENGYKADVKYDTDPTGNSVEYNNYDVHNKNLNILNDYKENPKQVNNNAPEYNDANIKLYSDYQTPAKAALYTDLSKEYYNDYSSEYNSKNYEPHQSKFSSLFEEKRPDTLSNLDFKSDFNQDYVSTTQKPNYLKFNDVLVKALPNVQPTFDYDYPKQQTTENVVLIGGRNRFTNSDVSDPLNSFVVSTPRSYLVSTIASLRDRVSSKPLLSDSFINRINKYLSFK